MGIPQFISVYDYIEVQETLKLNNLNVDGDIQFEKIGLFGKEPVNQQSASTLSELILALQNYGFIS